MMETKEVELVSVKKTDESYKVEASSSKLADTASHTLLKPGTKIRPDVSEEDASKLAERLYGITTSEICPLISYDDRNFRILVDRYFNRLVIM